MNPFLNRGACWAGYVNSGSHALNAYPDAFITPSTMARSSASAPHISFAQDIERGPYGTEARPMKNANHLRPVGIVQIARTRFEKKPRNWDWVSVEKAVGSYVSIHRGN
jgi:hypothetical protein